MRKSLVDKAVGQKKKSHIFTSIKLHKGNSSWRYSLEMHNSFWFAFSLLLIFFFSNLSYYLVFSFIFHKYFYVAEAAEIQTTIFSWKIQNISWIKTITDCFSCAITLTWLWHLFDTHHAYTILREAVLHTGSGGFINNVVNRQCLWAATVPQVISEQLCFAYTSIIKINDFKVLSGSI